MTKNEILDRIRDGITRRSIIKIRIMILHKEHYDGIIKLKKSLRTLMQKKSDFHKRKNGFYNKEIEIFIYKESSNIDTFGSTLFFVESKEDADVIYEAIIEFLNKYYTKKSYYITGYFIARGYDVIKKELNYYEYIIHLMKNKMNFKSKVFETEVEAWEEIRTRLNDEINAKEEEIKKLKEERKRAEMTLKNLNI